MERIDRQAPLAGLVALCIAIPVLRDVAIKGAGSSPQMWAIVGYVAVAGAGILFLHRAPIRTAEIGLRRPGWRSVLLGLVAGFVMIVPSWHRPSVGAMAVVWLLAAVAIEEILFRGILFAALQSAAGAPVAIAGSSLVFTLAHAGAYGGPVLLMVLLGGLYLGMLRALTGDIWACGLAHLVMDLASIA